MTKWTVTHQRRLKNITEQQEISSVTDEAIDNWNLIKYEDFTDENKIKRE